MLECRWLPELECYDSTMQWDIYENMLYDIFRQDFITLQPKFKGNRVAIRKHPIQFGKEEAFFHVTCQDYLKDGVRIPDFRRCERIRWVRKFIENHICTLGCDNCTSIKVWNKPYKNTVRTHIMFYEKQYMVVLEKRENYFLLITAFYLEWEHTLRKKLDEYNRYCL